MSHPAITLVSSLTQQTFPYILWEILHAKDIVKLATLGLSTEYLDILRENFQKKPSERQKSIPLYLSRGNIKRITAFFPNPQALMDERSEHFRGLEDKTLFVPSDKIDDAYEAFRLSLYKYQPYLSQKKHIEYGFFVTEKSKKEIQSKKNLHDAIFWARDHINMPPKDANPESIVREIERHTWKNFTLRVFGKKDLEELGCNLLLAVAS